MSQDIATLAGSGIDAENLDDLQEISKQSLCENCGSILGGAFCHSCGQSSKSMIKFFGEVVKELLDDTLGYDSRLKHSLSPLFFKPGRLTLDYVKGKRFHYVLPFKLYLITSVLFILLIKNTTETELNFDNVEEVGASQQISEDLEKDFELVIDDINEANAESGGKLINFHLGVTEGTGAKKHTSKERVTDPQSSKISKKQKIDKIDIKKNSANEKPIHSIDNNNDINLHWNKGSEQLDGIEKLDDGLIKTFFSEINPKIKLWKNNPKPLIESIIETLPYMMFVILPIFAIFLKIFYLFSRRFYTEHLIFLLHNHSFIYMLMMVQIVLDLGHDKLLAIEHPAAQYSADFFNFVSVILSFWMIIYVFLAIKRFYRQGWGMTIFKAMTLGFVYLVMLTTGFVATVVFGAYQA